MLIDRIQIARMPTWMGARRRYAYLDLYRCSVCLVSAFAAGTAAAGCAGFAVYAARRPCPTASGGWFWLSSALVTEALPADTVGAGGCSEHSDTGFPWRMAGRTVSDTAALFPSGRIRRTYAKKLASLA